MNLKKLAAGLVVAGAGVLLYGTLVESHRLKLETRRLYLPNWPERLAGFKIALLADLHLRDVYTAELTSRAIEIVLEADPDMLVLAGDYVGFWREDSARLLGDTLAPLVLLQGRVVAVPGNHDYWMGDASQLAPIFEQLEIKLLRNEIWSHAGVQWVGVDSANAHEADPGAAFEGYDAEHPGIVIWHEPDMVDWVPAGPALMLSGHSHGGQFVTPWGWAPMHTRNGRKYVLGFYPEAPTPVYVSRGLGTTGPPSRFNCPPEVTILTIFPTDGAAYAENVV